MIVVELDFGNRPSTAVTMIADKSTLRDGWEFYCGCMLKARALFFWRKQCKHVKRQTYVRSERNVINVIGSPVGTTATSEVFSVARSSCLYVDVVAQASTERTGLIEDITTISEVEPRGDSYSSSKIMPVPRHWPLCEFCQKPIPRVCPVCGVGKCTKCHTNGNAWCICELSDLAFQKPHTESSGCEMSHQRHTDGHGELVGVVNPTGSLADGWNQEWIDEAHANYEEARRDAAHSRGDSSGDEESVSWNVNTDGSVVRRHNAASMPVACETRQ